LRTTEFGGHLGARLTWQFQPGWALHLGGTAGPVWMRSRMTESDCFVANFVRNGTPCGSSIPGFSLFPVATATDNRTTIGFHGTATLGLVADLRFATVSLAGFGRYDSRIPGVQNPQQPATVTFAPISAARIRFQDGFAYGGSFNIRFALPN